MTELERRILAAEGYIELGLHSEAREELSHLSPESQNRADVIELVVLCLMGEKRWAEGLALTQKLRELEPKEPGGYIHAAYCLHELGQTHEALDLLSRGPSVLQTKPVYYYNIGCYLACLGQDEKALKLLEQSFEMDGSLRSHARKDPDLASLRQKLEKI
jgi:tetratricopeptide (TPR) repeat protein